MAIWIERSFSAVPPLETASELACEIRAAVFDGEHRHAGKCDLHRVCAAGRFFPTHAKLATDQFKHDALLVPRDDGSFAVLIDPVPPGLSNINGVLLRQRNRFRLAHEIGHSFFYNRAARPATRLLRPSLAEEVFCDEFASVLLTPRAAAATYPPDPQGVFDLHEGYDVSVEAAARALAKAHGQMSIVGMMWRPNPKSNKMGMRVIWTTGPRFVPLGARLHSEIVDAAETSGRAAGVESLGVGELRGEFQVVAARIPGRKQLVVVLAPKQQPRASTDLEASQAALPF